jgi:hypothetical protein
VNRSSIRIYERPLTRKFEPSELRLDRGKQDWPLHSIIAPRVGSRAGASNEIGRNLSRWPVTRCVPAPDVQADFDSIFDWHSGMPCPFVTGTVTAEVFPVYGAAFDGLESNALELAITIYESTPFGAPWRRDPGEIRSTTSAVGVKIDHECADSAGTSSTLRPVKMMDIVPSWTVSLSP